MDEQSFCKGCTISAQSLNNAVLKMYNQASGGGIVYINWQASWHRNCYSVQFTQ